MSPQARRTLSWPWSWSLVGPAYCSHSTRIPARGDRAVKIAELAEEIRRQERPCLLPVTVLEGMEHPVVRPDEDHARIRAAVALVGLAVGAVAHDKRPGMENVTQEPLAVFGLVGIGVVIIHIGAVH